MRNSSKLITLILSAAIFFSCSDLGSEVDHSNIPDAFSRWHAYNLQDYSLKQSLTCFCINGGVSVTVVVKNNQIINVVETSGIPVPQNQWQFYKTVDQLFDIAKSINPDSVARFSIDFDLKYGYPKWLYVDPNSQMADEEYGYQTEFISGD